MTCDHGDRDRRVLEHLGPGEGAWVNCRACKSTGYVERPITCARCGAEFYHESVDDCGDECDTCHFKDDAAERWER